LVIYILYAIFFLSCIALVASVLLQPGKTDAGALFTSNISSTAFNPRGTQTVLSKITIAAAVGFMVSALLISMPALTGDVSVLSITTAEQPAEVPANANTAEVNSNTAPAENANIVTLPAANINAAVPPASNTGTAVPKKDEVKKDAPKPPPAKK
jgi:preprotein translocase subunit SecG